MLLTSHCGTGNFHTLAGAAVRSFRDNVWMPYELQSRYAAVRQTMDNNETVA